MHSAIVQKKKTIRSDEMPATGVLSLAYPSGYLRGATCVWLHLCVIKGGNFVVCNPQDDWDKSWMSVLGIAGEGYFV